MHLRGAGPQVDCLPEDCRICGHHSFLGQLQLLESGLLDFSESVGWLERLRIGLLDDLLGLGLYRDFLLGELGLHRFQWRVGLRSCDAVFK